MTGLGPGSRHREREPQDRNAFPSSDTGVVFLRVALWWLRQSLATSSWPTDEASYDTQLLQYQTKLMLYYIEHGTRMSIRAPRAGETVRDRSVVEYHSASALASANASALPVLRLAPVRER